MRGITSLPRALLLLVTVVLLLGALSWAGGPDGPLFTHYYEGEARASSVTTSGPIRASLRQVLYTHDTQLYLHLENTGANTVILTQTDLFATPDTDTGTLPSVPYFLSDDQNRKYSPTGSPGWTFTAGDSPQSYGQVAPGRTADFLLSFPPIPNDVRALTLVMEDVRTQDGHSYDLRVPVPLPEGS